MKKILIHVAISITLTAAMAGTMIEFIKTNGFVTIDTNSQTSSTIGVHLWMFDGTTVSVDLDVKFQHNQYLTVHHHSESIIPFNMVEFKNKESHYLKLKK